MYKIHDVWCATVSDDGRNSRVHGYYKFRTDAISSVARKSYYGSDGYVDTNSTPVITINVDGELLTFRTRDAIKIQNESDAVNAEKKKELVKSALSKLTPEEIKSLGIDQ